MLTQQYQKLRLRSKNNLKRHVLQIIPVLSIFAILGMSIVHDDRLSAYAADDGIATQADTGASLVIDEGKIKDTILAGAGEFVYATHKVAVEASNIKSYSLTLSGPTTITANGTTLNGAGTGTAADNLNNQWGYAWIAENADPTTATYKSLSSSGTDIKDVAIDSTSHGVNYTKQLAFGAKFNSNANNGHYTANVTLSLVATPYTVMNYSLVYNANNGSGAPATQTYKDEADKASHSFTVSSTIPTRSGYTFLGWADTNTATAAQYTAGNTITINKAATGTSASKTIYAVWKQDVKYTYTITFSENPDAYTDGYGSVQDQMPADITCASATVSCATTLPTKEPVTNDYCLGTFYGWSTNKRESYQSSSLLKPGDPITISSNTTLYAIWRRGSYGCPT